MSTVAEFEVEYTRFMDETGKLVASPPDSIKDPDWLVAAYRLMVLTRTYDAKAISLQRTGQLESPGIEELAQHVRGLKKRGYPRLEIRA